MMRSPTALSAIVAFVTLALWQTICTIAKVPEYLVPTPSRILATVVNNLPYLSQHLAVTAFEAIAGFMLAAAFGLGCASVLARYESLERISLPYLVTLQAIPIVAMAPLFILWFGAGYTSKIAMAMTLCFFPTVLNTIRGLRAISREQTELFQMHGASDWQIFVKLRLPTAVRHIFSGLRVSAGIAMIAAVVAEYAGANSGIGYVIMQSTYRLDTPLLFAAILTSCAASLALFGTVGFFESRFFAKYLIQ